MKSRSCPFFAQQKSTGINSGRRGLKNRCRGASSFSQCKGIISLQTGSRLYFPRSSPQQVQFSSIYRYSCSHAQREGGVFRRNTGCSTRNETEGKPAHRKRHSPHGRVVFSFRIILKRMKQSKREFPRTVIAFTGLKTLNPELIRELQKKS